MNNCFLTTAALVVSLFATASAQDVEITPPRPIKAVHGQKLYNDAVREVKEKGKPVEDFAKKARNLFEQLEKEARNGVNNNTKGN